MPKIFVYGTLKRNGKLQSHMHLGNFIKEDSLRGYDMYPNGSYPLIFQGEGTVSGELWEIPYVGGMSILRLGQR